MNRFSTLSFREKSAWVSLSVILLVYIPYFFYVWSLVRRGQLNIGTAIGIFTAAQIAISIRARIDSKDERDAAIEGKAFRNAYFVLTAGICLAGMFVTCIGLAQGLQTVATDSGGADRIPGMILGILSPAAGTQILLLCLVMAEATKYGTQVFCYRRGS